MDRLKNILKDCSKTALQVSLVVGISLSLINQSSHILELNFTTDVMFKIGMNFLIPFLVASYSRYTLMRENELKDQLKPNKQR